MIQGTTPSPFAQQHGLAVLSTPDNGKLPADADAWEQGLGQPKASGARWDYQLPLASPFSTLPGPEFPQPDAPKPNALPAEPGRASREDIAALSNVMHPQLDAVAGNSTAHEPHSLGDRPTSTHAEQQVGAINDSASLT